MSPGFARTTFEAELSLTKLKRALYLVVFILILEVDRTVIAGTFLKQSLLHQLLEFFLSLFLPPTEAFVPKSTTCHFAVPADVEIAFTTVEIVFRQRSNSVAIRADAILHVIALFDHRLE